MSSSRLGRMVTSSPLGVHLHADPILFLFLLLASQVFPVPATRADTQAGWLQVASSGPHARSGAAMAYDSIRGKTVLFGGSFGLVSYGDTWEWDGGTWRQVATSGPALRTGHSMAYDSARRKVVLYGGYRLSFGNDADRETWEWDGTLWRRVAINGPPARYPVSMAYDNARRRTVLFGMFPSYSATWEWNEGVWTQMTTSGPETRQTSVIAYDSARRKTVLFGGYHYSETDSHYFGDTWEWNGQTWQRAAISGPSPRAGAAMAYDSAHMRTVLFSGRSGTYPYTCFEDTWEWDGSQWRQVVTPGPGARGGAAMAYDSARGQCILFGGSSSAATYGDTWVYTPPSIVTPFTLGDAIRSVQWSAGLATLSATDRIRCDVETGGASAGCVDMLDACRIARKVAGLEPNP